MNFTLRSCVEGWPHSPGYHISGFVAAYYTEGYDSVTDYCSAARSTVWEMPWSSCGCRSRGPWLCSVQVPVSPMPNQPFMMPEKLQEFRHTNESKG